MRPNKDRKASLVLAAAFACLILAVTGQDSLAAVLPSLAQVSRFVFSASGLLLLLLSLAFHAEPHIHSQRSVWLALIPLPWVYASVLDLARGELDAFQRNAFGLCSVIVVLWLRASLVLASLKIAVLVLTAVSLALAMLDPRWVLVGGRDWLPVIIDGRAFGLLAHPNALGQLAAMSCLLAWASRGAARRCLLTIGVLGLLAAASQTAALALTFASLLALAVGFFRNSESILARTSMSVTVVVSLLMLLGLWVNGFFRGLLPAAISADYTLTGRTEIWRTLMQAPRPIFGFGSSEVTSLIERATYVGSTHNSWLDVLLTNGWPGVLIWALAIFALWRVVAMNGFRRAGLAALLFFMIECVTESSPMGPAFFPIYLALVLSLSRVGADGEVSLAPRESSEAVRSASSSRAQTATFVPPRNARAFEASAT